MGIEFVTSMQMRFYLSSSTRCPYQKNHPKSNALSEIGEQGKEKNFPCFLAGLKKNLCRRVPRHIPTTTKTKNNWTGKRRYFESCRQNGTVGSERRCADRIRRYPTVCYSRNGRSVGLWLQIPTHSSRQFFSRFHESVYPLYWCFVLPSCTREVSSLWGDSHCEVF
jgi:hypothetical protein